MKGTGAPGQQREPRMVCRRLKSTSGPKQVKTVRSVDPFRVEKPVSEKILFVDDETAVLEAFQRMLRSTFDIRTASSGDEGLKALECDGPFGVVISDMQMPGMNGAEFLARVREKEPGTVRMLLTGHADMHTAIDAVNRGQILHFLTKPCPKNVLVAAINSGLDQYRTMLEEKELSRQARSMQRSQEAGTGAAAGEWERFRSPAGLPGPSDAKALLAPLIGKDVGIYTVLFRVPVLNTIEQRYGESATTVYLKAAAGFLQSALAAGDRLFHWRRDILVGVLRRHISPAAVGKEMERLISETRSCVVEAQGKLTMIACIITFDLLAADQFSGFEEWLAAFESRCEGRVTAGAGAP